VTPPTGPARRRPPRGKGRIGGANPLTDSAEHTDPVSPLAGATWSPSVAADSERSALTVAAEPTSKSSAVPVRLALPEPYEAEEEVTGPLSDTERAHLQVCEAALDQLRTAFRYAGQALQVIRDARLYRETHATFEEYVLQRWGISRPQAYRWIDAWPLAERLSPIGDTKLTESHVRPLVPVARHHGQDAAATVYETVVTTDGVRVTADLIQGAVSVLPEQWDTAQAVERIRAYLAGDLTAPAAATVANDIAAASKKVHRIATRVIRHAEPDAVRAFATELRTLADEMEKDLT
jgi:hypothetical protein